MGVGRSGAGLSGGAYGGESKRVHFDTEISDILLFELASQVTLDESGLHRSRDVSNGIPLRWLPTRVNKFFVDGGERGN